MLVCISCHGYFDICSMVRACLLINDQWSVIMSWIYLLNGQSLFAYHAWKVCNHLIWLWLWLSSNFIMLERIATICFQENPWSLSSSPTYWARGIKARNVFLLGENTEYKIDIFYHPIYHWSSSFIIYLKTFDSGAMHTPSHGWLRAQHRWLNIDWSTEKSR